MRKSLLLLVPFALALAACGDSEPGDETALSAPGKQPDAPAAGPPGEAPAPAPTTGY